MKSNTAENAKLQMEAGQTLFPMAALTDDGDHISFDSGADLFSDKAGSSPVIRPDGLATGGVVIPGVSGTDDKIDVAALTCYLAGVLTSVAADPDLSITRAVTTDTHMINSVTIDSGGSVVIIAGTDHASAFSEVRAADGGPPLIPVGSIEIAQIRTDSFTAAVITVDEVFDVPGQHQERYDFPLWDTKFVTGKIEFDSALPLSHTGVIPKGVFAKVYEPIFVNLRLVSDFVPPENSHSVSSEQVYSSTIGTTASSLVQGTFTARLQDGIGDPVITNKDETLWFKFFPDKYKTPYILSQGKLGVARTFPAGGSINASCTISASEAATGVNV